MREEDNAYTNYQVPETIYPAERNISYVVTAKFNKIDSNGNFAHESKFITQFNANPRAVIARMNAFDFLQRIHPCSNSKKWSKEDVFDFFASVLPDVFSKEDECILTLSCVNQANGNTFVIADSTCRDDQSKLIGAQEQELEIYREFGYFVDDAVCKVKDRNGKIKSILKTPYCNSISSLYYVTARANYNYIHGTGIFAERDGYIRFIADKDEADAIALDTLHIYGEYVIVEVSIDGITSQIEPDVIKKSASVIELEVRQPIIKPEYITGHWLADTTNPNRYLINKNGNHIKQNS